MRLPFLRAFDTRRGRIDFCQQSHVLGWAGDRDRSLPVELWVNGQRIATAQPNMPRPDLHAIGLTHGFSVSLPEPLAVDETLEVRHLDGTPLEGSPCTMHQARLRELLHDVDLANMAGLEIGPLDRPILSKAKSNICYVDHVASAALKQKYAEHPDENVRIDQIRDVDFVWAGGPLPAEMSARRFDFVIASHVIEHVPDMIGWLKQLQSVLTPHGRINLAVPDKQHTFDWRRNSTSIAQLISNHVRSLRRPCAEQVFDHVAFATSDRNNPPIMFEAALAAAMRAENEEEYIDVHCQVFTLESFAQVIKHLAEAEVLNLEIKAQFPTRPGSNEFIVSLGPSSPASRP
jgi:SAM-dependent methyltransferase